MSVFKGDLSQMTEKTEKFESFVTDSGFTDMMYDYYTMLYSKEDAPAMLDHMSMPHVSDAIVDMLKCDSGMKVSEAFEYAAKEETRREFANDSEHLAEKYGYAYNSNPQSKEECMMNYYVNRALPDIESRAFVNLYGLTLNYIATVSYFLADDFMPTNLAESMKAMINDCIDSDRTLSQMYQSAFHYLERSNEYDRPDFEEKFYEIDGVEKEER